MKKSELIKFLQDIPEDLEIYFNDGYETEKLKEVVETYPKFLGIERNERFYEDSITIDQGDYLKLSPSEQSEYILCNRYYYDFYDMCENEKENFIYCKKVIILSSMIDRCEEIIKSNERLYYNQDSEYARWIEEQLEREKKGKAEVLEYKQYLVLKQKFERKVK